MAYRSTLTRPKIEVGVLAYNRVEASILDGILELKVSATVRPAGVRLGKSYKPVWRRSTLYISWGSLSKSEPENLFFSKSMIICHGSTVEQG